MWKSTSEKINKKWSKCLEFNQSSDNLNTAGVFCLKLRRWNREQTLRDLSEKRKKLRFPDSFAAQRTVDQWNCSVETPSYFVVWSWRGHMNYCHNTTAEPETWRQLLEMGEKHFFCLYWSQKLFRFTALCVYYNKVKHCVLLFQCVVYEFDGYWPHLHKIWRNVCACTKLHECT